MMIARDAADNNNNGPDAAYASSKNLINSPGSGLQMNKHVSNASLGKNLANKRTKMRQRPTTSNNRGASSGCSGLQNQFN